MTIAQKILKEHLVDGEMVQGQEIGLRIDQTLTQDATGTMAYLQFEAMGVDQVRTEDVYKRQPMIQTMNSIKSILSLACLCPVGSIKR